MNRQPADVRFAFIVPQNVQITDLVLFCECLHIANHQLGATAFEYDLIQLEDASALAGITSASDGTRVSAKRFDAIVAFGTNAASFDYPAKLLNWLRCQSRHGARVGSIANGAFTLARNGFFKGHNVALPIHAIHAFRENFPNIEIAPDVFVSDKSRFSCAGGVTTIDLAVRLIADQHGFELAGSVADRLAYDLKAHRARHTESLIELEIGRADPPTHVALKIMQENVEAPISISSVALKSGVSIRQLQRRFACLFSTTPTRYYAKIRLWRARSLLQETKLPVIEVSQATGFGSHATFSKKYRSEFGRSPSSERILVRNGEPPASIESMILSRPPGNRELAL